MLPAVDGQAPILALMPTPGDVDLVLAAEFMEAGRSMMRGLVTPDRTTLITSTHRAYAVSEKERPGDGVADPATVVEAAGIAAARVIAFAMQAMAEANGTVISATLFGALAQTYPMLFAGVRRLVDYQDTAYAGAYLDRMAELAELDLRQGGAAHEFALTLAAAKYLAVALAYDDVIRGADLKTRASRFERVRR